MTVMRRIACLKKGCATSRELRESASLFTSDSLRLAGRKRVNRHHRDCGRTIHSRSLRVLNPPDRWACAYPCQSPCSPTREDSDPKDMTVTQLPWPRLGRRPGHYGMSPTVPNASSAWSIGCKTGARGAMSGSAHPLLRERPRHEGDRRGRSSPQNHRSPRALCRLASSRSAPLSIISETPHTRREGSRLVSPPRTYRHGGFRDKLERRTGLFHNPCLRRHRDGRDPLPQTHRYRDVTVLVDRSARLRNYFARIEGRTPARRCRAVDLPL